MKIKKNIEIKQKIQSVITGLVLTSSIMATRITSISANTPGFNLDEAKNLTDGYTGPLKEYFLYVVPAVVVIAASILGIKYFFKKEEEKEDFDIYGKLINYGLVASVLQSLAVFMRIFGVM